MTFINSGLEKSIDLYMQKKDKMIYPTDYLVKIIETLVKIYGESNIINPYLIKNDEMFKKNLMIYNLSLESYISFITNINNLINDPRRKTGYFEEVQKDLINMIKCKKNSTSEDISIFNDYLYIENNQNPLFKQFGKLICLDYDIITDYYNSSFEEKIIEPTNLLSEEQYNDFGLSLEEVNSLDKSSLNLLNSRIIEDLNTNNETDGGRTNDNNKSLILRPTGFINAFLVSLIFIIIMMIIAIIIILVKRI